MAVAVFKARTDARNGRRC